MNAAADRPRADRRDAEIGGDCGGGLWVIAGDHHRPDARRPRRGDRVPCLRPRRVDHPDQTQKDHVALDTRIGRFGHLLARLGAIGDAQRAKRFTCQRFNRGQDAFAPGRVSGSS